MHTVFQVLGIVHVGVAALIVAGYVLSLTSTVTHPLMVWAARTQLLLGLVLVGLGEAGAADDKLNHVWVAIKLVVGLGVVACTEMASARQRKGAPQPMLLHVALGLTLLNVVVAYAFR